MFVKDAYEKRLKKEVPLPPFRKNSSPVYSPPRRTNSPKSDPYAMTNSTMIRINNSSHEMTFPNTPKQSKKKSKI